MQESVQPDVVIHLELVHFSFNAVLDFKLYLVVDQILPQVLNILQYVPDLDHLVNKNRESLHEPADPLHNANFHYHLRADLLVKL